MRLTWIEGNKNKSLMKAKKSRTSKLKLIPYLRDENNQILQKKI